MTAMTVRLADEKYRRLKALAHARGTSINRLVDEMATLMLAEFDAETRFQVRAARGQGQTALGLELLEKAIHPDESTK
jgi:predicted transcriptional regulator